LSRERVVETAVEIADAEGLAGLSMPKLARRLGVGVMSLYTHVRSKDDLVDAVCQRLLEQLPPTDSTLPWDRALVAHFEAWRAQLVAHPGLGDALATRGVTVPAVFDILEANLGILREAGLAPELAARTYYTLLAYTLGFAAWELPRAHLGEGGYAARWDEVLDGLPPDRFPTLHELGAALGTVAGDEQFRFGLERLLAGVASKVRDRRSRRRT
jgi:AcrR family transcriptional regulator